ncbi:hypothetical protein [Stratiformator vulcanicus]|nr:hypothetical protein [Stratiformator vulcanicus]
MSFAETVAVSAIAVTPTGKIFFNIFITSGFLEVPGDWLGRQAGFTGE